MKKLALILTALVLAGCAKPPTQAAVDQMVANQNSCFEYAQSGILGQFSQEVRVAQGLCTLPSKGGNSTKDRIQAKVEAGAYAQAKATADLQEFTGEIIKEIITK